MYIIYAYFMEDENMNDEEEDIPLLEENISFPCEMLGLPVSFGKKYKSRSQKRKKMSEETSLVKEYEIDETYGRVHIRFKDEQQHEPEYKKSKQKQKVVNYNNCGEIDGTIRESEKLGGRTVVWKSPPRQKSLRKYFAQRYRLFSLFDNGVWLDSVGWYSATPEIIAKHLADRFDGFDVVVDAFCGVGGNIVQFAKKCSLVIGVEIDRIRLMCAKHNSEVYGVEKNVELVLGDCHDVLPSMKADAVFLSPPWGGPSYLKQEKYDLSSIHARELLLLAKQVTDNVAFFLPRNASSEEIGELSPSENCEIEVLEINGALKGVIAYWGDLILSTN